MKQSVRRLVRKRASLCCEYCQLEEQYSPIARLQVEHIRPRKHGGTDDPANLSLACIDCNLRKGSNLTGFDPETDQIVELFNPRKQLWEEHFAWVGFHIKGLTDVGRTTVRVLDMNSDDRLQLRTAIA